MLDIGKMETPRVVSAENDWLHVDPRMSDAHCFSGKKAPNQVHYLNEADTEKVPQNSFSFRTVPTYRVSDNDSSEEQQLRVPSEDEDDELVGQSLSTFIATMQQSQNHKLAPVHSALIHPLNTTSKNVISDRRLRSEFVLLGILLLVIYFIVFAVLPVNIWLSTTSIQVDSAHKEIVPFGSSEISEQTKTCRFQVLLFEYVSLFFKVLNWATRKHCQLRSILRTNWIKFVLR